LTPARSRKNNSYVPYVWQRTANPEFLIFLRAAFSTCTKRRNLNWQEADYAEQPSRLAHARQHADLIVETDDRAAEEVLAQAIVFLEQGP
jgi:hypothetical protein